MIDIVFIGDEVSAAGFRLAGARIDVPAPGKEVEVFEAARREARLVLLTAQVAACLPPTLLSRALIAARPLLLVVPDIRARRQPPDLSHLVRAQLGIEA